MDGLPPLPGNQEKNLTLPQELLIIQFRTQCEVLSRNDLVELSTALYRELFYRDNCFRELLKKDWGLL
jgi:hypothetical protein